jgi:hypothetical protein
MNVVFGYEGILNFKNHGFQGVLTLLPLVRGTHMSYSVSPDLVVAAVIGEAAPEVIAHDAAVRAAAGVDKRERGDRRQLRASVRR